MTDLSQPFVPPPPLTSSRTRDVALTAGGRALVGLAVVLFAAAIGGGAVMFAEARRQSDERRAILADGVVTTGVVTELWQSGDRRRRVAYEFVADGRRFWGERQVSDERRRTLLIGSPIDVRYLPSNPAVNDLGGRPRNRLPMAVPLLVAPVVGACGAFCLFGVIRQRRLLSEGRVAPAVVTGHASHRSSHGSTHLKITYEFPLMNGAVASGRSSASRTPPAVGSVITVVYDPDEPGRSAVYPFSLVKPVR